MPASLPPQRHRAGRRAAPLLALLFILAGGPEARSADPVVVHIDNFTFGPDTITVAPGTAVTWINGDDIPHTVVAKDRLFRSKALDTEDRYTFVFTQPGKYPYFCSLHPHMTGTVVVTGPAG
ncbi:cupredoxin family copper-binding protein [Methylobacterium sp. BTF04]|uniref:cupredoxin domain-containing protein n=1 Tax=Methylobacterium sp. BTF04 TaxID=2708300 RepID=UPI0013D13D8C|nr:cupredoxin family copper-binding protein [Methylobacterium sp. BTF04]NEU14206.1 cupredoxin family copper-binding protein [Methylobacterium sp. BTF04]